MEVVYLGQVAEEHVSFVLQGQRDQVAQLRVVQLGKITLPGRKSPRSSVKLSQ